MKVTVWDDLVSQLASFGLKIFPSIALEKVKWITTPTEKMQFNRGTTDHELEFLQQSTIRCIEQPNYKSVQFAKISSLTKTDVNRVVSIRGTVKNLEKKKSVKANGKDRFCVTLEQADGQIIEIVFFPNTFNKVTFKVQARIAILGGKFSIY